MQAPAEHGEGIRVKALSLRHNFSWTLAGNIVYAASQGAVMIMLARSGPPQILGQFALGLALFAPIILFANMQLRAVQATDALRQTAFAAYLGLRLLTTLLAWLALGFILASGDYPAETIAVIGFIGLAKGFEALSDVFFGLLQQHERMDRIAQSLMIEGPATLIVMGLLLHLTGSIVWATAGMALVWMLQWLLFDLRSGLMILRAQASDGRAWPLLKPRFDPRTLLRLAWLALPLGFVMLLISLNTSIPRYFIASELGEGPLGIFAAMAYWVLAGNTLVSALGQATSPRLSAYYAGGDWRAYRRLLGRMLALGAGLGLAGILLAAWAGEWLLGLIYGPAYAAEAAILPWIMLAAAAAYLASLLGYGLSAQRQFSVQAPINLLFTGITLLASASLIPRYGLAGAALASLLSYLLQIPVLVLLVLNGLRKKTNL